MNANRLRQLKASPNIDLGSITHDNPLFIITSRAPAHIAALESADAVRAFLDRRISEFDGDLEAAFDFEMVDLAHS